jgi:hypothetical protein
LAWLYVGKLPTLILTKVSIITKDNNIKSGVFAAEYDTVADSHLIPALNIKISMETTALAVMIYYEKM